MACNDLKLKIDAVDRTSLLIHETLTITQTNDGLNSTCTFDLLDQAVIREGIWTVGLTHITDDGHVITGYTTFFPQTKVDICITNAAETLIYFAGTLARISATHMGQLEIMPGFTEPETQVLRCECQDYNQVLEELVIDDFREYGGLNDEQLIDAVFDEFVAPYDDPYNIDYATFVTAVPHAFDIITFDSITVRQFMDTLCGITGAVWYVDYSRKLHYAADEADLVPPWHLSDNPDGATSFRYFDDITKEKDATNLVNRVFVVCGTDLLPVSLWFIDQDSIDKYGSHRAIVRDTSLFDIDDIEDKGNSILEKFKDPIVTYVLKTYKGTPGGDDGVAPATPIIRAGQHIRVVCAFYDLDETFKINSLTITFPVDGTPVFEITCGGLDSSASGSATRSTLDQIHVPNITPSSLPIAARGWGHDLTFTAPDGDTVAWSVGTITTADGQEFDIAPAADTGDMGAVTYVYLDTSLSLTALQHSVNPEDSIGLGKILIAVCAPDGAAVPTRAMYQVFGGGRGVTAFLHADNIAANCITANEIYGNSLEVVAANIGVLTIEAAGEIRAYAGVWDANADGYRITHDEIAGQKAGTDTFVLTENGIVMTAGSIDIVGLDGRIIISNTGISLFDGTPNRRVFMDSNGGIFTFTSAEAGNPRIEIDNVEIAGYDGADVKQFYLSAADGVAYAGAGKVWLDGQGLTLSGENLATATIKWSLAGTIIADQKAYVAANQKWMYIQTLIPASNLDRTKIYLEANAPAGSNASILSIISGRAANEGWASFAIEGSERLDIYKDYVKAFNDVRIVGGLYVGGDVDPVIGGDVRLATDLRVNGGISLGSLVVNPNDNELHFNSATYRLRRSGTHIEWYDGGAWVQLDNGP